MCRLDSYVNYITKDILATSLRYRVTWGNKPAWGKKPLLDMHKSKPDRKAYIYICHHSLRAAGFF